MLSIGRIFAGEGWRYLWEQVGGGEDYYLADVARGEAPGRWGGRAAQSELDLMGTVSEEQMRRVFGALSHPTLELPLGRAPGSYRRLEERLASARARHEQEDAARWVERELALVEMGAVQDRIDAERSASRDRADERWARVEADIRRGGQRQAVAGYDLTYSPPKSVSVLWAAAPPEGRRAIWAAHHEGVAAAMTFVETEAALSRSGYAGVRQIDTTGLITASFDHRMSRAGDVHIHTHTATVNRVKCQDGEWRSLDGRALYRVAAAAGAIYDRVREAALERDLGVSHYTDPQTGAREIIGVEPELRRLFSARRTQVTGRLTELVDAWRDEHGAGPSEWMVTRMSEWARQATRPHKGPAESTEAALARWEAETRAQLGRSLQDVWSKATGSRGDTSGTEAEEDDHAIARAAISAVDSSHSTWTRYDLVREIARRITVDPANAAVSVLARVDELVDRAVKAGNAFEVQALAATPVFESPPSLRRASDDQSVYEEHGSTRYTRATSLATESHLLDLAAACSGGPAVEADLIDAAVVEHHLDGEQAAGVRALLASGRRLDVMIGPAGTGKTTTMGAIADAWRSAGRNVLGVSIAENATRVLADHIGGRAVNAAKLVYEHTRRAHKVCEQSWWKDLYEVSDGSLVILDEAGMASRQIVEQLAGICQRAGAKLLLVGDPEQLDSPEAGGIFELIAHQVGGSAVLSRVRRFDNGWEREASLRLRKGDASVLDEYDRRGRITGGTAEEVEDAAFAAAMADRARGLSVYLLADTNEVAGRLAGRVRDQLVAAGQVGDSRTVTLGDGNRVGVGDQIVTRDNDRLKITGDGRFVANRDLWTVTSVSDSEGLSVARHDSGDPVELDPRYVEDRVQLAYAGTVHAAQGGTRDVAHAILTNRSTRTGAYVALTRGRTENHAYVVCRRPEGADHDGPMADPLAVLAGILERPDPPHQSAALTVQTQEHERAVSLANLFPVWQDLVAEITARQAQAALAIACGPTTAAAVVASTSWPTLAASIRRLESAGIDSAAALIEAASERTLDGADDLAAVIQWRLGPAENAAGDIRETFLAMTPRGHDELSVTAAQVATAMDVRSQALAKTVQAARPAWAEELGKMPAEHEPQEGWLKRTAIVAGYREAFDIDTAEHAIGAAPPPGRADAHAWWTRAAAALENSPARLLASSPDERLEAVIDRAHTHLAAGPTPVGDDLRRTAVALRQARSSEGASLSRHEEGPARAAQHRADQLVLELEHLEQDQSTRDAWSMTASRLEAQADLARTELDRRAAREGTRNYPQLETEALIRKLHHARVRASQAAECADSYESRAGASELSAATLAKAIDEASAQGAAETSAREQIAIERQVAARINELQGKLARTRFGMPTIRGRDRQLLTDEVESLISRHPALSKGGPDERWDALLADAKAADQARLEQLRADHNQAVVDVRWYRNTSEQMRTDEEQQRATVTEIRDELSTRTSSPSKSSPGGPKHQSRDPRMGQAIAIAHRQLTESPPPPRELPGPPA